MMPIVAIWAASWQNQRNDLCAQRRLKSSAQFDQSLQCAQWKAEDPSFLHADSKDWSDWADSQADLSLRWAHIPFCWFCGTYQIFEDFFSWAGQFESTLGTHHWRQAFQPMESHNICLPNLGPCMEALYWLDDNFKLQWVVDQVLWACTFKFMVRYNIINVE